MYQRPIKTVQKAAAHAPVFVTVSALSIGLVVLAIFIKDILVSEMFSSNFLVLLGFAFSQLALVFLWQKLPRNRLIIHITGSLMAMEWAYAILTLLYEVGLIDVLFNWVSICLWTSIALFFFFAGQRFSIGQRKNMKIFPVVGILVFAVVVFQVLLDWSTEQNLRLYAQGRRNKAADINKSDAKSTQETNASSEWSYEGDFGPEFWAGLRNDYQACGSRGNQSPIDISSGIDPMRISLRIKEVPSKISKKEQEKPIAWKIEDSSSFFLGERIFKMDALQLHSPSEHQIGGLNYPLELQLSLKNKDHKTIIASVFFEIGAHNPELETIITASTDTFSQIQLMRLIPLSHEVFRYRGSLTSPPCTEGIDWIIFKAPLEISTEQLTKIRSTLKYNARPVQALGLRTINE